MKVFAAILLAVLISSQTEADLKHHVRNLKNLSMKELNDAVVEKLGSKLHQHLENIKEILKNGNETLGIPVCDPFEVEHVEDSFKIFDGDLKGFGSLDNLSFTGLSGYDIEKAEFSVFRRAMSLTLKWPLLHGKTSYITNAIIQSQQMNFYGAGDLEETIEDLRFETVVYFGLKFRSIYVKEMDTKISLGNNKFTITGFYHDEDISKTISTFITEFVQKIVQEHQKELVEVVNGSIMPIADEYLSNMSLKDLISLLS